MVEGIRLLVYPVTDKEKVDFRLYLSYQAQAVGSLPMRT